MHRLGAAVRWPPVFAEAMLLLTCAGWVLVPMAAQLGGARQADRTVVQQFQEAVTLMESRGDCVAAIKVFEQVAASTDRRLAASALFYAGVCFEQLGRREAEAMYRRVLAEFPEQETMGSEARKRLAALPSPRASAPTLVNRKAWAKAPDGIASRLSLDGRTIAFHIDDNFLFADAPSASIVRRIRMKGEPADERGRIWDPVVLSPDGSEAAFTFERSNGEYELRIMQSDTGEWRTAVRAPKGEFIAACEWNDPQRLLVSRATASSDGRQRVRAISPNDGSAGPEVELPSTPYNVSISPDGRFIVYDAPDDEEPENRDVFLRDVQAAQPVRLAGGASDEVAPRWTADGTRVVFASDRTGTQALWTIEVKRGMPAGLPQMLYSDAGVSATALGLSRDGSYYYLRQIGLSDVYLVDLDERGRPRTAPAPAASRFLGTNMGSSWGPENTLVYNAREGSTITTQLAIRNVERGVDRLLNTGMGVLRFARWSPDGHAIVVKGYDNYGRYGIYVVDPESGRPQPVVQVSSADESTLGAIGWTADSQSILYNRSGTLVSRLVATGEERMILGRGDGAGRVGQFDVLPSTNAVAFIEYRRSGSSLRAVLAVLNADGEIRVLTEAAPPDTFEWPAWMPDGRSVLIVRRTAGAPSFPSIWRVSIADGALAPLEVSMAGLRNIGVSRDGRHLAFTAGSILRDYWVLENLVPAPKPPRRTPIRREARRRDGRTGDAHKSQREAS